MTAFVELVELDQFGIGQLRPAPWSRIQVVREDAHGDRDGDRSLVAQKKGGDALGVYDLDGDKLKIACVVGTWNDKQWKGKPRPTEFKSPIAEVVLELRRVKLDK